MIAKYNDNYFNISLVRKPTRIWKYDYIEGFNKKIKKDGLIVYEKYIELNEIDEIFEIGFSVCWDGQWCGIFYSASKELLSMHTNDRKFAENHGMTELERGVYSCAKPASCFTEYRMWTRDLHTKKDTYTIVDYKKFKILWKQMISDLIPPR